MEHRWGQRIVVDIPIHVTASNDPVLKSAQLSNLSVSGALITADFRPRVLSRVRIVFGSSGSSCCDAMSIAAYIAQNYRHGIGVEWCESASSAVAKLLRASNAGSGKKQLANLLNSSRMAVAIENAI